MEFVLSNSRSKLAIVGRACALAAALLIPITSMTASAQSTGRITGTVTDSASGRPIADVQVTVGGTRLGAVTENRQGA